MIGAGGAGSLLVEYSGRLGVGHLVVVDPDRIDNLSRVVGSTQRDARSLLTYGRLPQWLRSFGEQRRTPKVAIAEQWDRQHYIKEVGTLRGAAGLPQCGW